MEGSWCFTLLCHCRANNKHISESADIFHLDANENVFLGLKRIVKEHSCQGCIVYKQKSLCLHPEDILMVN